MAYLSGDNHLSTQRLPLPLPVQPPQVHGLGQMLDPDAVVAVQVRNGPGDAQNSGVRAGRQAQAAYRAFQEAVLLLAQAAAGRKPGAGKLGVDVHRRAGVARRLPLPGRQHPVPHGRRIHRRGLLPQLLVRHGRHLHLEIDAVQERPGQA